MLSTFQGAVSGPMHSLHPSSFGENYDNFSTYESAASDGTVDSNMEYGSFLNPNTGGYYPTTRPLPQPHQSYDQQQQHQQQQRQQQQQQAAHGLSTTQAPSLGQIHPSQQQPAMQQHALPIIGQPQPSPFRASRSGTSLQGYRDPTSLHAVYQSQLAAQQQPAGPPVKRARQSPRRGSRSSLSLDPNISDAQSTPRSQPGISSDMRTFMASGSAGSGAFNTARLGPDTSANTSSANHSRVNVSPELFASVTTDQPSLVLSDRSSEEDRYLFELHEQFKGTRGKGMWDAITSQYAEKYPGSQATACLQMKFTRCFRRFILWPKDELECLLEAWREDEAQRFTRITTLMKEKGGGKKHDWKPADIEMILVRLELEEADMDESTKIRRRRRRTRQRKSSAPSTASQQHHQDMTPVIATSAWSSGFSSAGLTHPQYSLPPPQQDAISNYAMHYDDDDHSEVNAQLDRKYYSDSPSGSPDQDDIRMLDGNVGASTSAAIVNSSTTSENLIHLPPPTAISSASLQSGAPYGSLGLTPHTDRVSQSPYEQLSNRRMTTDTYRP